MRSLNWYFDQAKEKRDIRSDAALARYLGLQQSNIPHMRKGKNLPSYPVMEQLADMAGVTPDEAAVDFARWQAERGGSATFAAAYERLFRHVAGPAAALAIAAGLTASPGKTATISEQINMPSMQVYIMRLLQLALRQRKRQLPPSRAEFCC